MATTHDMDLARLREKLVAERKVVLVSNLTFVVNSATNKHHFDSDKIWRYKNRLEGDVWFRVLRLAYRGKQQVHENFVARQYQEAAK